MAKHFLDLSAVSESDLRVIMDDAHSRKAANKANSSDLAAARRILDPDAAGVFQFDNAMCEPTTHRNWALSVVQAEQHYGTV